MISPSSGDSTSIMLESAAFSGGSGISSSELDALLSRSVSILSWFCPSIIGERCTSIVEGTVDVDWLIEAVFRMLLEEERRVWLTAVSYIRRGDSDAGVSGVE